MYGCNYDMQHNVPTESSTFRCKYTLNIVSNLGIFINTRTYLYYLVLLSCSELQVTVKVHHRSLYRK